VIVNGYVPAATAPVVVTVSVALPLPVNVVGLKLPLAPDGNPLTDKFTTPLNPFNAPIVTVYVVLPPASTPCDPGVAPSVKSGGGVTVRLTPVVWVRLPSLPVMVNGYVPGTVALPTVSVIVELPLPVTVAGLKPALTPTGSPATDKVTTPV